MPETGMLIVLVLVWLFLAILLGLYIRIRKGSITRQLKLGFLILICFYIIGLALLFFALSDT